MKILPYDAAAEAAQYLKNQAPPPSVAVVLGSGLGIFGERLVDSTSIPYDAIPHFPKTGVKGHAGVLTIGKLSSGGPVVAAFCGRSHLYEGHSPATVVHPTRTMSLWGVSGVVYTNAAGAIHPKLQPGDLMLIRDQINMSGRNPLFGPNDERLGPRFPDMTQAYDREFIDLMKGAARDADVPVQSGVYLSLQGPSYETPAEIKAFGAIGADAVGMSTVLSVIAARHVGLRVAGVSCITNFASGITPNNLSHDEVKETANRVQNQFVAMLKGGMAAMDAVLA